jgi:hypothetical protein
MLTPILRPRKPMFIPELLVVFWLFEAELAKVYEFGFAAVEEAF